MSSSSLATPTTFTWEIAAFSTYESSRAIVSPVFVHEGASLQLIMLPNGFTFRGSSSTKELVVFYLGLVSEHTHFYLHYEISLRMQDGHHCCTKGGDAYFLNKSKVHYNWHFIISRAHLFDPVNELVNDDTVTVRVQIASKWQIQMPSTIAKARHESASQLAISLKSLLESGKHADIKVHVSGREFPAHKTLLAARSPVFAAMFETDTLEAANGAVTIEDFDPEVIQLLLLYIYTDRTEQMDKYAFELFKAADKYQLESLKKLCESYLLDNISTETVSGYLLLAHLHQAGLLQARCIDYFLKNAAQVMDTEAWKEVMANTELATLLLREATKKK